VSSPRIVALVAVLFNLLGQPAMADKRVALIIGNSSYEHVARLRNPANDAAAITKTLKDAGFDLVDSPPQSQYCRDASRIEGFRQ
jgi:hypothetical protein